jgi:hypothetical protein
MAVVGLDVIVGVLIGAVPRRREQLVQRDRVGRRLVGDDLHGRDPGGADGPLEEAAGCLGVALSGDEHVDDLAELVDRAVAVAPPTGDLHLGLVHEPAIPDQVAAGPGGVGQQRREPLDPAVDGGRRRSRAR